MANSGRVKTELKKAFESAKSVEEMMVLLRKMESHFEEKELGYECLLLAQKLDSLRENPEKIIRFGKRALKNLLHSEQENLLLLVCPLRLLATVSYRVHKYEESLRYLKWAEKNLDKLDCEEENTTCGGECNMHALLVGIQLDLFTLYSRMGKLDEAAFHMERVLKVKERMGHVKGCVKLGDTNRDVCNAYIAARNFKAALPFALKALEIYKSFFGYNSVRVGEMKGLLGVIYCGLGEDDKALELNQSCFSLLRSIGRTELIHVETERCNMMIEDGEYEEAMKGLKAVVSNFRTTLQADRGLALVCMGRAFCYMEKFDKAEKYMKIAHEILEKEHMNPLIAAVGFGDMSLLYEMMGDFETALSLSRRVLDIPQLPQKLLVDGSTRLFTVISLAGKQKEGISYLEDALEKLKESFGPEHSQVGYCYVNLGITCRHAHRWLKAIEYFGLAKAVLDVSLGPNHLDSLKTSQTISMLYTIIGRYDEAIEIQQKTVEGLEGLLPREEAFLEEAVRVLDKIKKRKNSWCSIL